MAQIKIKRPNGEERTFRLTTNLQDTGGNYIRTRKDGTDYYARVSGEYTPLQIRKSNGELGYVQEDPVLFNTWNWENTDTKTRHQMWLWLPTGKYRITFFGNDKNTTEITINSPTTIKIVVYFQHFSQERTDVCYSIESFFSNWVRYKLKAQMIIERIGGV